MHRSEEHALDAEGAVDNGDDRSCTVSGDRAVGDDALLGLELLVVDAHHHSDVRLVHRRDAQDNTFGAGVEVLLQLGAAAVARGRLDHHVDTQLVPLDVAGFAAGEHFYPPAISVQRPFADRYRIGKPPHDRIVLEQVLQVPVISDIAHRRYLDILSLVQDAEQVAADATEAHQTHLSSHCVLYSFFSVLGSSKFRTDCRVVADGGISAVSKMIAGL